MEYHWNFSFLTDYGPLLWRGLWGTAVISGLSLIGSTLIGLLIGMGQMSPRFWLRWPSVWYVELLRNTPALVHLYIVFFVVPVLLGHQVQPIVAAVIALSLYSASHMAEIFRGGIRSVERGHWEAAKALGLGFRHQMQSIVLPIAIKRMVPPFTNKIIELVKLSSLASLIGYRELVYQARLIATSEFRPIEAFTVIAIMFGLLLVPLSYWSRRLENRLAKGDLR
ncbi:amino acid ABC transporter permease [soil metagenome]